MLSQSERGGGRFKLHHFPGCFAYMMGCSAGRAHDQNLCHRALPSASPLIISMFAPFPILVSICTHFLARDDVFDEAEHQLSRVPCVEASRSIRMT